VPESSPTGGASTDLPRWMGSCPPCTPIATSIYRDHAIWIWSPQRGPHTSSDPKIRAASAYAQRPSTCRTDFGSVAGPERLRERHHVVSGGYLRAFTLDGRRALFLDKGKRTAKLVGVRDMFTVFRLNSVRVGDAWVDDLERQWDRIENLTLPLVRPAAIGDGGSGVRQAVKVLGALHLIRSYGYLEAHERVAGQVADETPDRLQNDEELRRMFEEQFQRPPAPDEIAALVRQHWEGVVAANHLRVERMAANYNKVLDRFEPMHVQLLFPNSTAVRFVTGETPVVHFDRQWIRLGLRSGLALDDADHFFMPLAPNVGAMFTTSEEDDLAINPILTKQLNQLVWRASSRFLVCSPADDPNRVFWHAGFTSI
jgi:Protein of unknown function (DUF4238)